MTVRPVLEIDLRTYTKPGESIPDYSSLARKMDALLLPGGTAINIHVHNFEIYEENLPWIRPDLHIQPCGPDWENCFAWAQALYMMQHSAERGERP